MLSVVLRHLVKYRRQFLVLCQVRVTVVQKLAIASQISRNSYPVTEVKPRTASQNSGFVSSLYRVEHSNGPQAVASCCCAASSLYCLVPCVIKNRSGVMTSPCVRLDGTPDERARRAGTRVYMLC